MIRWKATIVYRTDTGPLSVDYDLSEIEELQDIVERGPHWDTVYNIKIERQDLDVRPLTIEEAALL